MCLLQIIYAALDWIQKPSKGNAQKSACIAALVELLLPSRSAKLDMTQACCLGVPTLLHLLADSTYQDTNSRELVTVILDIMKAEQKWR